MPLPPIRAILLLLAVSACVAQEPTPTITTRANLVVVDLVLNDRAGNLVSGLTPADLTLTDNGKPQTINSFDAHTETPVSPQIVPRPANLAPGIFSNAQAPASGAPVLNILLVDALNTPLADQTFLHQQLLQFLRTPSPGPMAVFGLTTHLIPLQGFTADPRLLRAAVDRMGSRASTARSDPISTGQQTNLSDTFETSLGGSDREFAAVLERLRQFEAEVEISQDRMRQHETLDALDALANYLGNLPGRKNLIWFSGAFPLDIVPDSRLKTPFRGTGIDLMDQLRETSALLTRARVALYPVDARGLFNVPTYDVSARTMIDPASLSGNLQRSNQQIADEHEVMRTMADETGGHAFVNTNGLARAIHQAITLGSSFYTLTYTPTPSDTRASLHRINVHLTGQFAAVHPTLSYRRSYFSTPTLLPAGASARRALTTTGVALDVPGDENALRLAMIHDAPEISAIPITAEVRPTSAVTIPQPDPETHPASRAHGPWRTFSVDLLLPTFALLAPASGASLAHPRDLLGTAQFTLHAYSSDGILLASTSSAVRLRLPADAPDRHAAPIFPVRLRISLPSPTTDLSLRIGVQNLATGVLGSLELPIAAVNNLPPAPSSPSIPGVGPLAPH